MMGDIWLTSSERVRLLTIRNIGPNIKTSIIKNAEPLEKNRGNSGVG